MTKKTCPECGALHNFCWMNMETDKVIEELVKCRSCYLGFGPQGANRDHGKIKHQITLEDYVLDKNI